MAVPFASLPPAAGNTEAPFWTVRGPVLRRRYAPRRTPRMRCLLRAEKRIGRSAVRGRTCGEPCFVCPTGTWRAGWAEQFAGSGCGYTGDRVRHVRLAGDVLHGLISCDIEGGGTVADILIRDIPDEVIAAIDARAKRVGLSRTEYLRRTLERERVGGSGPVTVDHLQRVASLAADLGDPDVMSGAWT